MLEKFNSNYNKVVSFKIENNLRITEYKILPYQEIIFDSKLLPIEIKKMELLGMVQTTPVSSNYIDSINNPKVTKNENKKPELKKEEPKKKKTTK